MGETPQIVARRSKLSKGECLVRFERSEKSCDIPLELMGGSFAQQVAVISLTVTGR